MINIYTFPKTLFMVLFYKAITYILKSSYRAKEGLSVGLIHRAHYAEIGSKSTKVSKLGVRRN